MASRLAFQTQLASIMEVLANAAVAEICKLVDDDYAVVSLQMSQCQRENKALKRKLHLMELKMARGFAERRLRESAGGGGRARVHVGVSNDRFRSSSSSGVMFGQMDMGSWPGGVAPGAASREPTTCDLQQDTSADIELVETELVKQEKMEETEEEVQLIRADGQLERAPGGGRVQRSSHPQQEVQAAYHHNECPDPALPASTRGVEKEEPDVMLVKQEAGLESPDHTHPTFIIQEESAGLPLDISQATSQPVQEIQECGRGFSETPADPQAKPSEELCTTISVHGGAPDTITPAKDSTSNQPRQDGSDTLASECSVLDLEAFFTRWTPDSGAPPAAPPSCSFSTEELLEEEEEEVVLVEEGHQPPRRRAGAASSQRSSRIHTNHSPSSGTSLSASPRIQAPPPQLTWSRAAAMMRNTQTQSLQHGRHGNRTAHRVLPSAQNSLTTTANANTGLSDVSHIAGTRMRRLANFHSFPPAGLPARGSEGKGLGSDSSELGGVSIGLDGVSSRLGGVNIGLDGVSMGLDSVSMGLGGVNSRLGGVSGGLGGGRGGAVGVSSRLGSVSGGLGGANAGLGSVSGGLAGVSGGLGGVSAGLGGVRAGLGGVSARLGGGSRRRNYACRACGKAFSGLSNLEAHQRVHTGEKPFCCSTCGKRFSEAGNLKKHQRVHTGDKPYGCQRCGKRFAWVCSLRTHQQSGTVCGLQGGGPGDLGGLDQ